MKVKTMLYSGIVASIIASLATGAICLVAFKRINIEIDNVKKTAELTRNVFESKLIMHQYMIYREQRPLVQWKLHADRMSRRFQQMKIPNSGNRSLLAGIKKKHEAVLASFISLTSQTNARPGVSPVLIQQTENRLQSRILVKLYDIFNDALHIARASEDYLLSEQKTFSLVVFATIFSLSLVTFGISFFTAKSILKPLGRLQEGAEIIAKGNLNYQVEPKFDNEIGKLTRAFNQMINDLKSIMISRDELELKVEYRTTKLKESEARYRSLVEAAPVSIMAIQNGCIHFANPAGARMLGFSDPGEMVGLPAIDIVAPESHHLISKRMDRLIIGKDNPMAEIELIRQDGRKITVESTSVSIHINGIPAAVIITQDISNRKEKEEKLQMMRFSMDSALDRIAWIAPDGRFLYANEAACKEMGYTIDELLSMSVSDIGPDFPEDRWSEHFQEVKKRGSMRLEIKQISGDGQVHDIEVANNYLKFGDREFMCSFGRDITDLKKAEMALLKSQEDLRKMAGRLLSIQEAERRRLAREMHDDLTQRLAVIAIDVGTIEKLFQDSKDPVAESLQNVREKLAHLSSDIHAISRQLHPSILDDLGLIEAVKSECNSFTRREGIAVDFHSEDMPLKITKEVAVSLYRIVQEGLRNVAKHSGSTSVNVALAGQVDSIHLMIKDQGAGFDPYESENELGLGLVSMQERVRLVRGEISIDSRPGEGTVLNICVPADP